MIAPNDRSALAHAPVDVVVLDVRMPEMGGTEFWTQVSRTNPALAQRTVFCAGDVVTEEVRAFLEGTSRPVVSKPFELSRFFDPVARAASR
jgi:CheY-like chemotaxis protein